LTRGAPWRLPDMILFLPRDLRVEASDSILMLFRLAIALAYIDRSHKQISPARSIPVFFLPKFKLPFLGCYYIYVPSVRLIHQSSNQIFMVHIPYI
jgi:hypothetical protein